MFTFLISQFVLFAIEKSTMIEYGNLFCISFYEYEIHHFCNEEKVDSIINAEKKVKENGEIYFFKNDDIFVFSEKTRFLKSAILKSEKFSVASKKIIPTESTLEDVNNVFGRNAKKIENIIQENEHKLKITYFIKKKGISTKFTKNLADENFISFIFDYETFICEAIILNFEDEYKTDLEYYLIQHEFSKITTMFSLSAGMTLKKIRENEHYKPFQYSETKKICNIDVEFVYTFIDFGQEMINQYVEAIFIDVDGKKKKYEKENINMEKSTRKIVTTESLFDTNGIEVKNPVLYLWE